MMICENGKTIYYLKNTGQYYGTHFVITNFLYTSRQKLQHIVTGN
jgi:hypothetical protein